VVGGGLTVGTVLLIEEDVYGSYSKLMLKFFLAEAVLSKHSAFVASADVDPQQLTKELPGPVVLDPGLETTTNEIGDSSMKIAWRYQNLPQVQSSPSGVQFGHYYDMTKQMSDKLLQLTDITYFHPDEQDCQCQSRGRMRQSYVRLLKAIKAHIDSGKFSTDAQPQHRTILRIGIHSLGSPQWGEEGGVIEGGSFDPSLCQFLYALRATLRCSYATAVITMATHLFQDAAFIKRMEHMCDTVVRLDSFIGSDKEKNPAFKEYHGLFHVVKLPRLNALTCHELDTYDLAFKLRRKKFTIEKLHLPPELADTAGRSQEDGTDTGKPSSGCFKTGNTSKLDF
ncbi:Elongator complex protein 4, partial [Lamellibrachia satsuma]